MKHIRYKEGQWFAVPLPNGGYGLGIIVRGSYRTKGGLGYFFGPIYDAIPLPQETFLKNKDNAILIRRFGDLGIINGEWPLISDGKPFSREEWPVPLFHIVLPFPEGKATIVKYSQDYSGSERPIHTENVLLTEDIAKLPENILSGSKALEKTLYRLLSIR